MLSFPFHTKADTQQKAVTQANMQAPPTLIGIERKVAPVNAVDNVVIR